jgi:hypothetical protein
MLGVHHPTDVLAGKVAGAGRALLCWMCADGIKLGSPPDSHGDHKKLRFEAGKRSIKLPKSCPKICYCLHLVSLFRIFFLVLKQ